MKHVHILLVAVLLAPVLTGCLGSEMSASERASESAAQSSSVQFMLKFRDGRDEQGARVALPALSRLAGLEMTYVRPMSGQAHVLRFPAETGSDQIEQALRRLRADPAIEYAEPDRRVKIQ